jgi:tRNA dimethylallyltransferase
MTAETKKIKILAVVGSTASGKTALSIALAKALGGEIVSCDSMQLYRRMDIGTAKPTKEEMDGVAHHLLDFAEPDQPFSCAEYVTLAQKAVLEIQGRGKLPIFCGGTGLYLDSVLRGGGFEETETDPILRQRLLDFAAANGNHALHERLRAVDPESAEAIHENNVKRVVRALEIFETSGMTKTEADRRSRLIESPYDACVIGLRYEDREILYDRIGRRVEQMLKAGLLEETRSLMGEGVFERNSTAAQAIGYKELLGYLRGEQSLAEATEALKRATRRYAKRQITWFGAKDYVHWIDAVQNGTLRSLEELLEEALRIFQS